MSFLAPVSRNSKLINCCVYVLYRTASEWIGNEDSTDDILFTPLRKKVFVWTAFHETHSWSVGLHVNFIWRILSKPKKMYKRGKECIYVLKWIMCFTTPSFTTSCVDLYRDSRMSPKTRKDGARPALFHIICYLGCSVVICVVLCIVCV
jgi:hypothetical protein